MEPSEFTKIIMLLGLMSLCMMLWEQCKYSTASRIYCINSFFYWVVRTWCCSEKNSRKEHPSTRSINR